MIRYCHANYSHRKFSIKTLKSKNSSLSAFYHSLNFASTTKVTPATFLPAAHLILPLGALWDRDYSPLCSTGLFLLLDFALAQQNPAVFHKLMQRRKMAKNRCMASTKTNKQTNRNLRRPWEIFSIIL